MTMPEEPDVDVDVLLDDLPDVAGTLHELRGRAPALWARAFGQPALLLLTHELVNAAFRDEDVFPSAEFYGRTVTDVLGRNLQCMYGEEHRRNRALVSPAFRQRVVPGLIEPLLEPVAHELVDRFEGRGHAELVAEFTSRYPFTIITRLLGLPPRSEEEVKRLAVTMLDIQRNHDEALACSRELVAIVDPVLQRRRHDPGDDLLSALAVAEVDGGRLTDEEIFNFIRLLFPAGADTTYLGLGNTLFALLTNPDQMAHVLEDLDGRAAAAAEEGLRLNPPVAWIVRISPEDLVWHGIAVPTGRAGAAGDHRGQPRPGRGPDPDRYDVTRSPVNAMTFGFGTHFCLGAHLARAELATSLRVLLGRLPDLRLAETDGRAHHRHAPPPAPGPEPAAGGLRLRARTLGPPAPPATAAAPASARVPRWRSCSGAGEAGDDRREVVEDVEPDADVGEPVALPALLALLDDLVDGPGEGVGRLEGLLGRHAERGGDGLGQTPAVGGEGGEVDAGLQLEVGVAVAGALGDPAQLLGGGVGGGARARPSASMTPACSDGLRPTMSASRPARVSIRRPPPPSSSGGPGPLPRLGRPLQPVHPVVVPLEVERAVGEEALDDRDGLGEPADAGRRRDRRGGRRRS